mmetsp:Transcript_29578/g.86144  ORF Transcript_29578/g.86144 Transcript_29578/m.86144 type:complete len:100 (-) Transcript_29578:927-1226(-)
MELTKRSTVVNKPRAERLVQTFASIQIQYAQTPEALIVERKFIQADAFAQIEGGELRCNQIKSSKTGAVSNIKANKTRSIEVRALQIFTAGDFQPDQPF